MPAKKERTVEVYIQGGKTATGIDVVEWARKVYDLAQVRYC